MMDLAVLQLVLRCTLGLTFLIGAIPKLRRPRGFVLTVLEYRVLAPLPSVAYARLLPPLELLVALLLLTGTAVRAAALIAFSLLVTFIAAVGTNLARGRSLDCGCFGGHGKRRITWRIMVHDASLLAMSAILVALAKAWLAPERSSVFQLGRSQIVDGPWALITCVGLAACAAALLGASERRGRRWKYALARR